ncbi:MAG: SEL1-like repeat protein [Alphaproteobacteria bacterium]|nr:SEL1-like repeat protein [Alphaproteobacteria bacterium]MBU0888729.1 SEL1-like repeat protein [Alphaproteobacteria bacterium]MBU1813537.1 SEL1-like repeat protein [Alphaproteobacteria bacterium]
MGKLSKITPWSVKGIDEETRDTAREAAQAAGLTIGAWVDRAILRHAGLLPDDAPPANDDAAPASEEIAESAGAELTETLAQSAADSEKRLKSSLTPVALQIAGAAQRMVALESSYRGGTPFKPKPVASAEEWEERWTQFRKELASEEDSDALDYSQIEPPAEEGPPAPDPLVAELEAAAEAAAEAERLEEEAALAAAAEDTPATETPAARADDRPARRPVPGKFIVGAAVLVLGIAAGIGVMSQGNRLGLGAALERVEDTVGDWADSAKRSAATGSAWVEERLAALTAAPVETPAPQPAVSSARTEAVAPPAPAAAPAVRPVEETAPSTAPLAPRKETAALPDAPASTPAPRASGSASVSLPDPAPVWPPPSSPGLARPDAPAADTASAAPPDLSSVRLNDRAVPKDAAGFGRWVEDRAKQGERMAQHDLAVLYAQGEGRPQDLERAAYWFREAAVQGVASAQYNLGVLYETGRGVQQDDVRALLWYHSAAEQGQARAQFHLGRFYAAGRGIPVSYDEARKWLRRAGEQNLPQALNDLARMEEKGLGAPPDTDKARALYAQAMALGDAEAMKRLAALPAAPNGALPVATGAGTGGESIILSPGAERETVRAIQHLLAAAKYDITVDGLVGEKTRQAIRDYEKRATMPVTGEPSLRLMNHMIARSTRSAGIVDRATLTR